MRTLFFLLAISCSGMLFAQTTPFVDDWEGEPDMLKIRSNDKAEDVVVKTDETKAEVKPETIVVAKKTVAKKKKKMVVSATKKRSVKTYGK